MNILILDTAEADLPDGFHFYEAQQIGLGSYFLETLFSEIQSLADNAGIHPIEFGRFHKLLSKRFPFAVYYRVEEDETRVHAVLDCRSDPDWIAKRIN